MKTTEWQPISLIELKVMVEDAIEEFPVELRQFKSTANEVNRLRQKKCMQS
jgi:hypothetical protein